MREYSPAIIELEPIYVSNNNFITKICSSVSGIDVIETCNGDFINFNDLPEEIQNKIREQVPEVFI